MHRVLLLAAVALPLAGGVAAALAAGSTERVSISSGGAQGDDVSGSFGVAISGNGRFVAFQSWATDLVPGDTNAASDIFVRDRLKGTTGRVSLTSQGAQSDEGSYS